MHTGGEMREILLLKMLREQNAEYVQLLKGSTDSAK